MKERWFSIIGRVVVLAQGLIHYMCVVECVCVAFDKFKVTRFCSHSN